MNREHPEFVEFLHNALYDVKFERHCFNQINYENFLYKKGREDLKFHELLWSGGSAVEWIEDFTMQSTELLIVLLTMD